MQIAQHEAHWWIVTFVAEDLCKLSLRAGDQRVTFAMHLRTLLLSSCTKAGGHRARFGPRRVIETWRAPIVWQRPGVAPFRPPELRIDASAGLESTEHESTPGDGKHLIMDQRLDIDERLPSAQQAGVGPGMARMHRQHMPAAAQGHAGRAPARMIAVVALRPIQQPLPIKMDGEPITAQRTQLDRDVGRQLECSTKSGMHPGHEGSGGPEGSHDKVILIRRRTWIDPMKLP